ncbi:MAG TPA: flagellar motor switch protein FliM [Terriglobia bacterium]|nr:flagellar motor switch protein FliM [Terriglobia bacterium]
MEKILTQEEIDALFRAAQGRTADKPKVPAAQRTLAACNFRQSARISKEQLRSVSQLHELFARNLTHSLGAYLRLAFEVNLVSAEQLNYGEFLQRIPEVTYLVSMTIRPIGVSAAIEIDMPLAFPIIDVLLGGPGRGDAAVREITEIEEQILESVVRIIGRELENTWLPVLEVQFGFDQRLRQADISRLMPPSEKILSLSFEIRMPEARGMLNVALPAAVSNALLRKLTQQASYRKQRGTADNTSQMRRRLDHCNFPVQLVLPHQRVRVSQLLALEKGDVLKLKHSLGEGAHLLVSGMVLFNARPVRTAGRRAAQIDGRMRSLDAIQMENV